MGRPKGSKNRMEAQEEINDSTVEPVVLDHNAWMYHATEEPRLFKKGEEVPEGWEDSPAKFVKE